MKDRDSKPYQRDKDSGDQKTGHGQKLNLLRGFISV